MRLKVMVPSGRLVDEEVDQVTAEGAEGGFSLLPRHVDMTAALAPGLLAFRRGGEERFVAVHGGVLVKCGDEVLVASRRAVPGRDLGKLEAALGERNEAAADLEARAQRAAARLEADLVRRFAELGKERV